MKIGCLQFAPQVGDVDNNLNRADSILNRSNPGELDLLVLPELAFSGYNFKSLHTISPFLEPTGSGITSVWARTTALKHNCKVVVGYPETADVSYKWPTSPEYYNSAIVVNEDGDTCGHYRKSHLYYTDETWALEGTGFFKRQIGGIGKVAMGICMDINPYKFEAPWNVYEFATHVLDVSAKVVIVSMAWLTREDGVSFSCRPKEPDMETLTYWITRFEPLIRAENDEEIIIIFANRTGIEDDAVYAGTSAVVGIKNGEVTVYGLLGRGEKELLVVDTDKPGFAKLVYRPDDSEEQSVDASDNEPDESPSHEEAYSKSSDGSDMSSKPLPDSGGAPNGSYINSRGSNTPHEVNRRSSSGHIFVDSDGTPRSPSKFPESAYGESPISPRYFWAESLPADPPATQLSNTGIRDSYEEWRDSSRIDYDYVNFNSSRDRPHPLQSDSNPRDEFLSLMDALHDPVAATRISIDRPGSSKSRNASRNELRASKNSTGAEQPDKRFWQHRDNHSRPSSEETSESKPGQPTNYDINTNQSQGNVQAARGISSEERQNTMSPDLEKLGTDLMVFEEGRENRPKRDSLVCHVDEDDYVVLRAERKDATGRKGPGKRDEHKGRSGSRHSPQPLDSFRHNKERSRANSRAAIESPAKPVERKYTRSSSRGRRRDDDMPKSRSLSKKASRGQIATGTTSPPAHQLSTEVRYRHKHQRSGISGVESLSVRPLKQNVLEAYDAHQKHQMSQSTTEQKPTLSGRNAKHTKRESNAMIAKTTFPLSKPPTGFCPVMLGYSPNTDAAYVTAIGTPETELTIPDRFLERPLPTPKAMILPLDYDSGVNGHQSAPIPPRNQALVAPLKCLSQTNGVQAERPRSAVW